MGRRQDDLLLVMIPFVGLITRPVALAQDIHTGADARQWVIESVGRATASPDVIHLMMKMEIRLHRLQTPPAGARSSWQSFWRRSTGSRFLT